MKEGEANFTSKRSSEVSHLGQSFSTCCVHFHMCKLYSYMFILLNTSICVLLNGLLCCIVIKLYSNQLIKTCRNLNVGKQKTKVLAIHDTLVVASLMQIVSVLNYLAPYCLKLYFLLINYLKSVALTRFLNASDFWKMVDLLKVSDFLKASSHLLKASEFFETDANISHIKITVTGVKLAATLNNVTSIKISGGLPNKVDGKRHSHNGCTKITCCQIDQIPKVDAKMNIPCINKYDLTL